MRAEQKAQEGTAERRGGQELPTGQVRQEQATSWPWGLSWCSCFLPEGPARRGPISRPRAKWEGSQAFSQASRATWPPAGLPWWWGTDQVTPGLGGPGRGRHPSILHWFSTFNDRLHCASPGLPLGCPAVTAQPRESHGPCWSLERRRVVVWIRGQGPWETSSGQASGPGRKGRGTQPPSEPALPVSQRPSQGPTAPHTHPGRTVLCLSPTRPRGGQAWPVGPASVCAATQCRAVPGLQALCAPGWPPVLAMCVVLVSVSLLA